MAFLKTITLPSGSSYDITDYRGQLGEGGDISSLPSASSSNKGNIYSVSTAGTYSGKVAAVGDFFVSDGSAWLLIKATDSDTTYTLSSSAENGKITVTPSVGDPYDVAVTGLAAAAYKGVDTTVTENSDNLVTSGAVWAAIDGLPEAMVFKGTVGTGGTITNVPVDGSANIGDTYKVITDGTQAGEAVKAGDMITCLTKTASANTWVVIPAGDTDSDTWRNIKVDGTEVLGNGISTGAVDFVGGQNVDLTFDATDGSITIDATDTDTHRAVKVDGTEALGDNDTPLDLIGGTNVTLTPGTGADAGKVTIAATDTNTYVSSVSFADDTTSSASAPVKITLGRSGDDTSDVTGNIPKVSATSAGVAPKGATVSTQDQTTKFLREDGTWAAPSYTDSSIDTVRAIKVDGSQVLSDDPADGAVDFVGGDHATLTFNSTGNTITVDVSDLATTNIYGVASSTTTASHATAGTAVDVAKAAASTTTVASGSLEDPASGAVGAILASATVSGETLTFGSKNLTTTTITEAVSNGSITPYTFTDVTVPVKDASATAVVTGYDEA